MKKFNKISIVITLTLALILSFYPSSTVHAATNPNLGAAATFSVLASTLITGTPTSISGDVGNVNVVGGSSITGVTGAVVAGTIYAQDLVAPSEAIISAAVQANAQTAYTTTAGLAPEGTPIAVSELGGITRGAGVYDIPGDALLSSGALTLDGPGTYIFRTGPASNLTSSVGGSINFINGARPCDLFWNIGTAAEIGGNSFSGTILASTGIHFTNAGIALNGRALAVGADVTLNVNGSISGPTCPAPVTTATLTLVKIITNNNGGDRTIADFPLTATGTTTITGVSGAGSVTNATVTAGTYTLSETNQSDYTAGTWSCTNGITVNGSSEITLGSGNTTTCTINNDDIAPTLIVNKVVVNDNGGAKVIADFPLFVDGVSVTSGVVNTTTIGLHTVSETSNSDYVTTFGGQCAADGTITLVLGDVKTCTITNNDIAPTSSGSRRHSTVPPLIDVIKVPSPLSLPNGQGPVTYTYTLRNIGTVSVSSITMVGDTCSPIVLASGDSNNNAVLEVNETWVYRCTTTLSKTHTNIVTTIGWANGISATDIASATVVVGLPIVPPIIHVTKIPSPLLLSANGGMITYTNKVTNPGSVSLSNVRLADDKCNPVKYVSGDTNNNAKLDTTETWTYTCKSQLTKTTVNTITAKGDANGLTATDFAIATVIVSGPSLPNTGFPPEQKSSMRSIIIPAGLLSIVFAFYLARRKQTTIK